MIGLLIGGEGVVVRWGAAYGVSYYWRDNPEQT